ncbi:MAG: Dna2/Cas4 domain-containing protein [Anaerolineales bacterium]|nr:Dna2/Cas4 domain-containing protein [Anaerolineales bacterium]
MFPLAVFLFVLALAFLWLAARQRKAAGLPGGRVIYADSSKWRPADKPLTDTVLGLTGKPDYLVEQGNQIIPVEVKSTTIGQSPYDSHIFQLGAYCMLVERVYGRRPPYGILHYPNRTFAIDFTSELESAVMNLVWEMQGQSRSKALDRSHEAPERCAHCGFRSTCDQALRI